MKKGESLFDLIWRYVIGIAVVLLVHSSAHASGLFDDDLFFVAEQERLVNIERIAAIDKLNELQYLTQIALEKPNIFLRQVRLVQKAITAISDQQSIDKQLREAGFYSAKIQDHLIDVLNGTVLSNPVKESEIAGILIAINQSAQPWMTALYTERFEDYTAIECAPDLIPSHLTGPSAHQYMMRVAHPDMGLSLWRFDVNSAVTYPIAMVSQTTVNTYTLMDRFGQSFGQMDRSSLTITMGELSLVCSRFSASVLRAFKDHERELLLSEKQL